MIRITPVSMQDVSRLVKAATSDGHSVIAPTHLLEKQGDISGFLSIGAVPLVLGWLNSNNTSIFDTCRAVQFYEETLRNAGHDLICVPCNEDSPLRPYMEKAGYVAGWKATLFVKNLQQKGVC